MTKILWMCDVAGWAYELRAAAVARSMAGYLHRFIYAKTDPVTHHSSIQVADVIVCPHPVALAGIEDLSKVVQIITGDRVL